ncbi:hypothetical protein FZEAL_4830 [Fusarium zealandicum]|uniref:DUF7703 domain-containing protein n=1 Tax=Fusarium zealandicum TaxID=1053134 RepID=A0A8H4ULQ6_9HYPO|nr:hypothetical protein FZEAL_4830 [Fusarium zealandicum]
MSSPSRPSSERPETSYDAKDVMVIACSTLGLYNSCELLALIFITFKRRAGLYFWSLLITTFGTIPYVLGWSLDYFDLILNYVGMVSNTIGWILLITGQSVVLYSRLHLVLDIRAILRGVRWMIILNGFVWHTTMIVLLYTIHSGTSRKKAFNSPLYNTFEKVQLTFFCIQEFIISGLYIWSIMDILRTSFGNKRRFMWHLVCSQIFIAAMDIALLVIIYKDDYLLEQGVKVVVYSVKLKLEFATLGKLVEFVQTRGDSNLSRLDSHLDISGLGELSGGKPRAVDTKSSSSNKPEAVDLRDIGSGSGTSILARGTGDEAMSATERETDGFHSEGDELTLGQLYGDALRQTYSR